MIYFEIKLMKENFLILIQISVKLFSKYSVPNYQLAIISSDDGLTLHRCQAITPANNDKFTDQYVSPSLDEFNCM